MKIHEPDLTIEMVKGDNETLTLKLPDYTFIEGDKVEFVARETSDSENVSINISVTEFSDHKAILIFVPDTTKNLDAGTYVYDIQFTLSGEIKTIINNKKFILHEEIAR